MLAVDPPFGRWHCEQLACRYARARSPSVPAVPLGSGYGVWSAASLMGGVSTLISLSVSSWFASRPVCGYLKLVASCFVSGPREKHAASVWHCRHWPSLG